MSWTAISYVTLLGQLVVLVLAIRLFCRRRSRSFALLLAACLCFIIADSSWFTFGFAHGFLFPQTEGASRAMAYRWHERTSLVFQLLFVLFMILALISFLRERPAAATPSV
jgi:hypothetical protein